MTQKKSTNNAFADIISARQKQDAAPPVAQTQPTSMETETTTGKKGRGSKRGNPDYTALTVYVLNERYARVQFAMNRQGRKREISELVDELFDEWLARQQS